MSQEISEGLNFNSKRLEEQNRRNDVIAEKDRLERANAFELDVTRKPDQPNTPSEKGGYKRRRGKKSSRRGRKSSRRGRKSSRRRSRTMRK